MRKELKQNLKMQGKIIRLRFVLPYGSANATA
jgi:hypothetical protein